MYIEIAPGNHSRYSWQMVCRHKATDHSTGALKGALQAVLIVTVGRLCTHTSTCRLYRHMTGVSHVKSQQSDYGEGERTASTTLFAIR
jgi:hypothetical protein